MCWEVVAFLCWCNYVKPLWLPLLVSLLLRPGLGTGSSSSSPFIHLLRSEDRFARTALQGGTSTWTTECIAFGCACKCCSPVSGKYCGPSADACDSVRRENLQRLLDDRSFKEEIVHFSLSEESAVVKAAHRADLCPVLMRYLYYLKCEHKPGGGGTHP